MPARKRADVIKEKLDEARKAIEEEARRRLFKVDYEESRVAHSTGQSGSTKSKSSQPPPPLYTTLYQSVVGLHDSGLAKDAIDTVLLCLARAELTTRNEQTRLFYRTHGEDVWSSDIRRVMRALVAARTDQAEEREGEQDAYSVEPDVEEREQATAETPKAAARLHPQGPAVA